MAMRVIGGCKDGPCPKVIHDDETDEFFVQGPNVEELAVTTIPGHERVVRIPGDVMRESIAALQAGT